MTTDNRKQNTLKNVKIIKIIDQLNSKPRLNSKNNFLGYLSINDWSN